MERQNDIPEPRCKECDKRIEYGGDLIAVEKCVSGPRGMVPLGEILIFCSEECLSNYYCDYDGRALPKLPPRIP